MPAALATAANSTDLATQKPSSRVSVAEARIASGANEMRYGS